MKNKEHKQRVLSDKVIQKIRALAKEQEADKAAKFRALKAATEGEHDRAAGK